jgi:hypothetical protein
VEIEADARPPDFKPDYPSTCTTFKLSTSPDLNFYFGFTNNGATISPGNPAQIFNFFPQVFTIFFLNLI